MAITHDPVWPPKRKQYYCNILFATITKNTKPIHNLFTIDLALDSGEPSGINVCKLSRQGLDRPDAVVPERKRSR